MRKLLLLICFGCAFFVLNAQKTLAVKSTFLPVDSLKKVLLEKRMVVDVALKSVHLQIQKNEELNKSSNDYDDLTRQKTALQNRKDSAKKKIDDFAKKVNLKKIDYSGIQYFLRPCINFSIMNQIFLIWTQPK